MVMRMIGKKQKLYNKGRKHSTQKGRNKFKTCKNRLKSIHTVHPGYPGFDYTDPNLCWRYINQVRKVSIEVAHMKEKGSGHLIKLTAKVLKI